MQRTQGAVIFQHHTAPSCPPPRPMVATAELQHARDAPPGDQAPAMLRGRPQVCHTTTGQDTNVTNLFSSLPPCHNVTQQTCLLASCLLLRHCLRLPHVNNASSLHGRHSSCSSSRSRQGTVSTRRRATTTCAAQHSSLPRAAGLHHGCCCSRCSPRVGIRQRVPHTVRDGRRRRHLVL